MPVSHDDIAFDTLREGWPAQVSPICDELSSIVGRLLSASAHIDDAGFVGLINEIESSIQCLNQMIGVMVKSMKPIPASDALSDEDARRIQKSWRNIVVVDFNDLCMNITRLDKIAQSVKYPQLTECASQLTQAVDRLGDTLTVKFFINGNST